MQQITSWSWFWGGTVFKALLGGGTASPRQHSRRPQLESLEDRLVPTIGSAFTVSFSGRFDKEPAVASSANGMSIVVWSQESSSTSNSFDIVAQLFDTTQTQIGNDIVVSGAADDEFKPDVAMDAHGNFAIVWTRNFGTSGDTDVEYALYDNTGSLIASKAVADSISTEDSPQVAMSGAGAFVVAYTFAGSDIVASRFDAT